MNRLDINTIKSLCLKYSTADRIIRSPSGKENSWLIDLRPLFLRKDTLKAVADSFWEIHRNNGPFQLAGMETAAIPLLTALILNAPKSHADVMAVIIRKERKPHGLGNAIEGVISDKPIILVDDTFNSGTSAEKARSILASEGHKIESVFAVVDFQNISGSKWLTENNVTITSLFKLADLNLELSQSNPAPIETKFRQKWVNTIKGANPFYVVPKSAPVLANDRIYRGCDAAKMHCFDAKTGSILWEHTASAAFSSKGIWSTPAVHEERVYFGAYNGTAYCICAKTGEEIWTRSLCEWIGASPIVLPQHNIVLFGLEYERPWARGGIAALDLDTGEHVWDHVVKGLQHGSPAYWKGGDLVVWGTADHDMLGLNAKTGEPVWSFRTRRSVKSAPAVCEARNITAFASFDRSIYVLNVENGELLGQWETGDICYTTPLVADNLLFCGSGDRNMYVIDLDRMQIKTRIPLGSKIFSSPILYDNLYVVFGTNGGRLIYLNKDTLQVSRTIQLIDAITNKPAISDDGTLYVSTYMNMLFAIEP